MTTAKRAKRKLSQGFVLTFVATPSPFLLGDSFVETETTLGRMVCGCQVKNRRQKIADRVPNQTELNNLVVATLASYLLLTGTR